MSEKLWRIWQPYGVDSIWEIKAPSEEAAMSGYWNNEAEWKVDTDPYEVAQQPTIQLVE